MRDQPIGVLLARTIMLAIGLWLILGPAACPNWLLGADLGPRQLADPWLARRDLARGIWALPRAGDGKLALALAQDDQANLLVHAMFDDVALLAESRRQARAAGLLGYRFYAERGDIGRMPLAKDSVNVLLITDMTDEVLAETSVKDVVRVLTPETGVAVVGLARAHSGHLSKTKLRTWAASSGLADIPIEENDLGLFAYLAKPATPGAD